jgi:nucleobase:cation symporter-1, NCS1 family
VLLAAWAAIFLADMLLYRRSAGYSEADLYTPDGRYGAVNPAGLISFLVAAVVGLGLVTSSAAIFSWTGYLIGLLPGDRADSSTFAGQVAGSSIGLLIAFAIAGVLYLVLAPLMGEKRTTTPAPAATSATPA